MSGNQNQVSRTSNSQCVRARMAGGEEERGMCVWSRIIWSFLNPHIRSGNESGRTISTGRQNYDSATPHLPTISGQFY